MNMKMMSKCIFFTKVMYFIFYFIFLSILSYFIFLSQLRKLVYQDCKQHAGALMSISDGLVTYIFCRKMENAPPMMEEMDGKSVYFPPESAFLTLMLYF